MVCLNMLMRTWYKMIKTDQHGPVASSLKHCFSGILSLSHGPPDARQAPRNLWAFHACRGCNVTAVSCSMTFWSIFGNIWSTNRQNLKMTINDPCIVECPYHRKYKHRDLTDLHVTVFFMVGVWFDAIETSLSHWISGSKKNGGCCGSRSWRHEPQPVHAAGRGQLPKAGRTQCGRRSLVKGAQVLVQKMVPETWFIEPIITYSIYIYIYMFVCLFNYLSISSISYHLSDLSIYIWIIYIYIYVT